MEFWKEKGLSYIATMIGNPLHVDHITATCKRIDYARVCIEIDADDDLISEFELEVENEAGGTPIIIPI